MPSPGSAINPYLYHISIFETKKIFFREWTSKNIFDRHVSCRLSQVTGNQHIKSGLSKVFHYLLKIARQLFSQLLFFFFVDCINFQPPLQGSFQFICAILKWEKALQFYAIATTSDISSLITSDISSLPGSILTMLKIHFKSPIEWPYYSTP